MNEMPGSQDVRAAATSPEAADAPPRRSILRGVLKFLLAIAFLAGAYAGWRMMMASAIKPRPHAARETIEPVRVLPARLTTARPEWTLYGQAAATRRAVLAPPVSGRIVEVAPGLRAGAVVKKGQLLARIDDLPWRAAVREAEAALAQARAQLTETRARLALEKAAAANAREQLDIALRDLARAEALNKRGALPAAGLDKRRLTASQKRLAHAQRKANIAATEARAAQQEAAITRQKWMLERARKNLADTVLRAPFDGRVAESRAETGQQTGPADKLITLISSEPPEARLALSERRFGALKAAGEAIRGRDVRIIWDTSSGKLTLAGRVTRVTPDVAQGKGVIYLFARVSDPRKAQWLRPGAFIEARMAGPEVHDAALLPESAVYDASRVYAVVDGRLKALPVTLAGYARGKALVRGLKGGEMIVVNRLANPVEGRKTKVMAR